MKYKLLVLAVLTIFIYIFQAQVGSTNCANPTSAVAVAAPWYCSHINKAVQSNWARWEPLALLAVTLTVDKPTH